MNRLAVLLVVLAAACGPVSAVMNNLNGYVAAQFPLAYECLNERQFSTAFVPYLVDFDLQNTSYLLWVSNASISDYPGLSLDGDVMWCYNSAGNEAITYSKVKVSNYTVQYEACVGTVYENTLNSTECLITATNRGYTLTLTNIWVNDYTGSDYMYTEPGSNWTLINYPMDAKTTCAWDISVSCPGAEDCLVDEVLDVIRKEALVRLRDVYHNTMHLCFMDAVSQVDVTDF